MAKIVERVATMIGIQETYVSEQLRADSVTRRYGHQTKARRAAYRKIQSSLEELGYSAQGIAIIIKDADDMVVLERRATA